MYNVIEETRRVCERNRKDYKALAKMTGKTIAEIEADTTAPDPMAPDYAAQSHPDPSAGTGAQKKESTVSKNSRKLSNEMRAEIDDMGTVLLLNTRGHSPKRITSLTPEEMINLLELHTASYCPICQDPMLEGNIICDLCLEDARTARRLAR